MIVQREVFELASLETAGGVTLKDVRVGYECYGKLNAARDNVILVCHYFSGNAHAAGRYAESDLAPGWWDAAIGPGKVIDTDRYFVISSDSLVNLNVFDGHTVTTGPATVNPDTGQTYEPDFPIVTVTDFVRVQKALLEHLGIERLVAVVGPSGGSAQAIEWAVEYPECVPRVIAVISPGLHVPPYVVALAECWARPIRVDAAWQGGRYAAQQAPRAGLVEALRLTTLSALSFDTLAAQFGEGPADLMRPPTQALEHDFKAVAMLGEMAAARASLCDANHFLYMVRAYQLYDTRSRIHRARARFLFLPAASDLIFPPALSEQAAAQCRAAGLHAEVQVLQGSGGHVDGLSQMHQAASAVAALLGS